MVKNVRFGTYLSIKKNREGSEFSRWERHAPRAAQSQTWATAYDANSGVKRAGGGRHISFLHTERAIAPYFPLKQ